MGHILYAQPNPRWDERGISSLLLPPHIVAIQLVSFIPVGTPMIIVAAAVNEVSHTSRR